MPFAYTRKEIPYGVAGTMATVREIARLIREGTINPRVRLLAIEIVRQCPWKQRDCEARAVFAWLKANIRFTYDPESAELLQDVDAILRHRAADCDDFVIIGGSLLRSIGIPVRIVIIGADAGAPNAFSHIYLQAHVQSGWVGFDPSVVDSTLGWEPPRYTVKRIVDIGE